MIVIRLSFDNQAFSSDEAAWQQKLFGTQSSQLNHYYHEISLNQFEFSPVNNTVNVVDGIVTVHFYEDHPDPDIDSTSFEQQLHPYLKSAIETVSDRGFDFSMYDTNNNGSISPDELIITFIMAGEEDAYSGGIFGDGVWAHQWCTESSYTPTVNGVKVMDCGISGTDGNYAIFGERHHDQLLVSHDASVGIIAHELGHSAFNLPDLYYGSSTRIGYYGLMSLGSWGQASTSGEPGDTPTHMCAWSKIDTGWFRNTSDSNSSNTDFTLDATGLQNYNIVKVIPENSIDEYFLLENRGIQGYDAGLKHVNNNFIGGIAIWHIDEEVIRAKRADNIINSSAFHKGVDLEEAAGPSVDYGEGDPVLNLFYSSNVNQFTTNTVPSTTLYDGTESNIFITNISTISGTMSAHIDITE